MLNTSPTLVVEFPLFQAEVLESVPHIPPPSQVFGCRFPGVGGMQRGGDDLGGRSGRRGGSRLAATGEQQAGREKRGGGREKEECAANAAGGYRVHGK